MAPLLAAAAVVVIVAGVTAIVRTVNEHEGTPVSHRSPPVIAGSGYVVRSLEAAQAEAEREGWHELDDVLAEADQIIAAKRDAA